MADETVVSVVAEAKAELNLLRIMLEKFKSDAAPDGIRGSMDAMFWGYLVGARDAINHILDARRVKLGRKPLKDSWAPPTLLFFGMFAKATDEEYPELSKFIRDFLQSCSEDNSP